VKRLKKILAGVAMAFVVLVAIGFALPSKQHVERSIVTSGKAEDVFSRIAALRRWPEWTAWTTNRFPDMTMRFEGPDSGVGATMIAAGKSSGDGTVTIKHAEPASGIIYTLDFNHGTQLFIGAVRYNKTAEGLRITWTLDAELGWNPLKRWAGLAMNALMGGDMANGLQNLKQVVEKQP
jgi:hypothetical protein